MKATEIIKNLINLVGVTAGIIITSIGSILLITSFLKLYVLEIGIEKSYIYDPKWSCSKYDIEEKKSDQIYQNKLLGKKSKVDFTESEKKDLVKKHDKCIVDEKKKEIYRYFSKKKEDIADGSAFLIVGLSILFFYQRRRKNNK